MAPVNETDMVLLPEGLKALKEVAKEVGLDLRGASLNLDGGFDSAHNRKCIFGFDHRVGHFRPPDIVDGIINPQFFNGLGAST